MKEKFEILSKKWWVWVIVVVLIIGMFGSIESDTDTPTHNNDNNSNNNMDNGELEVKPELEDIYAKNENINKFLNEYNSLNPSFKITKGMISPTNSSIIYVHNTGFEYF